MARALTQTEFLVELEPVVEENLNRHMGVAKEWFPHEYVPWDDARTFDGILGGTPWRPEDSSIPEVARTSLLVNLLTEDNLPSYHHEIATTFGRDGAWGTWVGRWTAEEGRHAIVIRDYLIASRALDPTALERARMKHMEAGFQTEYGTMLGQLAYVSFQELATRIAHRNTGKASQDETCERILARVAADENLHMLFYRNLLAAALELDPNQTMRAITDVVTSFQMPGAGMFGVRPHVDADRPRGHLRPALAQGRGPDAGAAAVEGLREGGPPTPRVRRPVRGSSPSSSTTSR